MRKLIIFLVFIIFVPSCFAESIQDMHKSVIARKNAGGAAPSYLCEETFDGSNACGDGSHSNCDVGWTVSGQTVDFNDATGLEGTYSCLLDSDSGWEDIENSSTWSGASTTYVKIIIKFTTLTTAADYYFLNLKNSGSGMGGVTIDSNGKLKAKNGTSTGSAGSTVLSTGTTYYIWFDYTKDSGGGDGTTHVYVNTSDSKPGAVESEETGGNGASDATSFEIRTNGGNLDYVIDHIRIDDEAIN